MNDDLKLDDLNLNDEQLRLATSRTLPPAAPLDADTAAARDNFLAFGTALESAAAGYDEQALIKNLQAACVAPRQRPTFDWWPLIVTGALAAGMLLAVARLAMEARRQGDRLPVAAVPGASPSTLQPASAARRPLLAWTDPLDDEIALAAAAINQFSSPSRGFDSSLLDMNDRLEALSREIASEAL